MESPNYVWSKINLNTTRSSLSNSQTNENIKYVIGPSENTKFLLLNLSKIKYILYEQIDSNAKD